MRFERKVGSRQWAVGRAKDVSLASSLQPLASPRSGMTLVELLVVIILVTTLVSTAIPIISPGGDSKRLREASRNLNAYLQGAQARAIETGRPFGVAFHRLSADTERGADNAVCIRGEYVEVPAHYSGADGASLARVCVNNLKQVSLQLVRYGNAAPPSSDGLPPGYDVDLVPDRFIRPGDQVVIGSQMFAILPFVEAQTMFSVGVGYFPTYPSGQAGAGYFNTAVGNQSLRVFGLQSMAGASDYNLPLTHWVSPSGVVEITPNLVVPSDSPLEQGFFATAPAPFKLIRQPVPAGGEPLEMPAGVAVDLQASLFTNGERVFLPVDDTFNTSTNEYPPLSAPMMLLFSPQGNIDRFYSGAVANGVPQNRAVTSTLALCIGRRELIPPKPTEGATAVGGMDALKEPINLQRDILARNLSETEAKLVMDQYNWLNLDSRWVLVGGQSGAVSTIANSAVYPSSATASVAQQLYAATENARSRTPVGGR
jgi:type II secretory pathway pseudopilin PulG